MQYGLAVVYVYGWVPSAFERVVRTPWYEPSSFRICTSRLEQKEFSTPVTVTSKFISSPQPYSLSTSATDMLGVARRRRRWMDSCNLLYEAGGFSLMSATSNRWLGDPFSDAHPEIEI